MRSLRIQLLWMFTDIRKTIATPCSSHVQPLCFLLPINSHPSRNLAATICTSAFYTLFTLHFDFIYWERAVTGAANRFCNWTQSVFFFFSLLSKAWMIRVVKYFELRGSSSVIMCCTCWGMQKRIVFFDE